MFFFVSWKLPVYTQDTAVVSFGQITSNGPKKRDVFTFSFIQFMRSTVRREQAQNPLCRIESR